MAGCGETPTGPSSLARAGDDHLATVARVSITPATTTVGLRLTVQLNATAYDSEGNRLVGRTVHWSSSDAGTAAVNATGLVTGVTIGSASVSALCEGKIADAAIHVRELSVLVDASRDGGVWWYPQAGPFDPDLHHQGQALADYLRSLDLHVRELPRPTQITPELLDGYDLVVRAGACGYYTASEILAYRDYVEDGGRLLLLDGHKRYCPLDAVGQSFGVRFEGITRGPQLLMFVADPITAGLADGVLYYQVGSGLVEFPPDAKILAYLDDGSYLDLNANDSRDDGEPVAPPVMGKLSAGDGSIIFMGDVNTLNSVPQPLIDNILQAFLPGVIAGPSGVPARTAFLASPGCVAGCI